MPKYFLNSIILFLAVFSISCSKSSSDSSTTTSTSEDTSASGTAAGVVGSAISSSDSSGTQGSFHFSPLQKLFESSLAYAAGTCPTVKTAAGSGCSTNGNNLDLTYSSCSFGSSSATWTGTLEVSVASGSALSCGTFPSVVSSSLQRQFVSSGSPSTGTRVSKYGTSITYDHSTAKLGNFDGVTIATNIGTGYGTQVTFDGNGKRSSVTVKQRIYSTRFDHSVVGTLNISESGTTRTISSGTVTVYHNLLKIVGTTTFTNVVYNNTCTTPVSGTITTVYAAGTNVSATTAGSKLIGKSETLVFNACDDQTLTGTDGTSSAVSISTI